MKNRKPKKRAAKPVPVDGLGPRDLKRIRTALRQVWSWSHARRLCIARATGKDGFARCEACKRKVPKVYADHINFIGVVDEGFIKRLFCPSKFLQALCSKCHGKKTRKDKAILAIIT